MESGGGKFGGGARMASSGRASPHGDAEEEDEEVMRIPVFNRPSAAGHSLYLFQCPLRPQWRPYDLNSVAEAQIRPQQRRVDLKLPVDQSSATYDAQANYPLSQIGLTSSLVSPRSSYAVGMLRRSEDGAAGGGQPHPDLDLDLHLTLTLSLTLTLTPTLTLTLTRRAAGRASDPARPQRAAAPVVRTRGQRRRRGRRGGAGRVQRRRGCRLRRRGDGGGVRSGAGGGAGLQACADGEGDRGAAHA
eukprot:scaffold86769_cov50-Phaeocystis_antarctica.AAC.3